MVLASMVRSSAGPGLALALALGGCGGATPAAQAPIEVAVVNLDAASAAHKAANGKVKGEEGKMGEPARKEIDAAVARKLALAEAIDEAEEYGMIGLLNAGAGVPGGVVGGVVGGPSPFGSGGLGLSGIGVGGGGTGSSVGLGSIGTIGRGGGGSGSGFGSLGGSGSNPVPGQSVHVSGNTVIELGDSVTLGVTIEAATRMLRDRVSVLRACYVTALEKDRQLAGSVALRLVVGKDARVELARDLGSDLGDPEAITCMLGALKGVYVGYTGATPFFGVIETTVRFSPKK